MMKEYTQLLIDVQKKSGISIKNVRDIKNLKEEITDKTNSEVSFNTLRRIFGFLQSTAPSVKTLNILSNYLGFKSYSSYLNNKQNHDEWYFQQKLLNIQLSGKINTTVLDEINVELSNKKNIVAISYFISSYISKNNIRELSVLFGSLDLQKLDDGEKIKFATIITMKLLSIDKNDAIKIYQSLIKLPNFKNVVPLFYIDYSNLNGLYGKVIGIIKKYSNDNSDILFCNLMVFYKKYYSSNFYGGTKEIVISQNYNSIHPVLKGRYLSYLILSSKILHTSLKKNIINSFRNNQISIICQEVIAALILKEEFEFLSLLYEKFYEDIFETFSWNYSTTNSISLIGLANVNWANKEYTLAKNNLELIDLEKVELGYYRYISLFYYLTLLKISYSNEDVPTNNFSKKKIDESVLITEFKLFAKIASRFTLPCK